MELVDITVKELYHGTTKKASTYILTEGFKLPTWKFNNESIKKKTCTLGYCINT